MFIPAAWKEVVKEEFEKPYIQTLKDFVYSELSQGKKVYPELKNVFKALTLTPFDSVKVVIVGQDPYHGAGQAQGLSFSVPHKVALPPSLKNIFKELKSDLGISFPSHGCLESWASQGVLLLNTTLTVEEGKPKSHYGMGWETFTTAIIKKLSQREDPIVFILWGASAHEKAGFIEDMQSKHLVLKSAHPSPFSAHKFLGCRHFSTTNEQLKKWGKTPINWAIE
jgi:uracil-DNA glycosylase